MMEKIELEVETGPLAGTRYHVPEGGLRLGRSSSCEIAVNDPALSRNHCLFEMREDGLYVTDLASANGTYVNETELGTVSRRLAANDVVSAGDVCVRVVGTRAPGQLPTANPPTTPTLDLGFNRKDSPSPETDAPAKNPLRFVLWLLALAAFGAAAWIIFAPEENTPASGAPKSSPAEAARGAARVSGELQTFQFERVEADERGIHRTFLALDTARNLSAEIDFTDENRHVRKTKRLDDASFAQLAAIWKAPGLNALDADYTGTPLKNCELKSTSFRAIMGATVLGSRVENATEPEPVRTLRTALEAFSEGELGIVAIQYAKDDLLKMATEARAAADAKWNERDVAPGNLAQALKFYRQAVEDLKTVEPKPADYDELRKQLEAATAELDKRFNDQRFVAYRAVNLSDWPTAQRELRTLCDLVPDAADPRHREAAAKLLDVENRMKKGGR